MARCVTCHRRLAGGQGCPEHGGIAAAAEAAETGAPFTWDRPVGALLGSGGFASVWDLGTSVLKVAHADHELARARMEREAEALGAAGEPAVPRLDGQGVLPGGRAWIAMEKIVGASLTSLTYGAPIGAEKAVPIILSTLDALARVHAAGFIHRDLKPDNIYRRSAGGVVILDLGLARRSPQDPDDPTRANVQVGSLEYMPPEQLVDAAAVTVRSDLYAIGCILFELCAGRPPFVGDAAALERAHAALRPPRLGALAAVPAALEGICADCLAKDPAKRPRDIADLRARLRSTRDTPTMMRTAPAVSQIAESRQPVVLVWIELAKVDRAMIATLSARHVMIVSQKGRRILAALVGSAHADPAASGLALARDLVAGGAKVALHLDALRIEPAALHGEAVEKPESWLPTSAWTGVILTRAFASVTQVATRPADEAGPSFRLLVEGMDRPELFGREALLADLAADAAAAVRGLPPQDHRSGSGTWGFAGPAFAVLVGDAGVGKTAFAIELARRIGELGARVTVASVPAPGSGKPPPLVGLIGTPEGPPVRAIGDALRAVARTRPTVVILDDLHFAEHELLDALEYATLGGEALPLWILGVASSRLDVRRPRLGAAAERHRHDVLPVLEEDAAVEMTATLLRPAEYPPLRALRQLVSLARANPLHLTMLAREIHERGAIRKRAGGEFFLDTSALDGLEPIALGPWLAARELASMGPELVSLARVAAVLGDQVDPEELAAVVDVLERDGIATELYDVDVGMRELLAEGLVETGAQGYMFKSPLVQEGIYATTDETLRTKVHEIARDYWSTRTITDVAVATRIARHAEAAGPAAMAAEAFRVLGEAADREHRALDADQSWSGAIRTLPARTADRARALLGRARVRYRQQRVRDAVVDLDEALAIAGELRDAHLQIRVVIERATAHDWGDDFEASAADVVIAHQLASGLDPEDPLVLEIRLGEARALWRAGRFSEAVPPLREVVARARELERPEPEIVASVMLAAALVDLRELAAAIQVFDRVIPMCEAEGDKFHLGAAYTNRGWLWSSSGDLVRCAEDLELVIQLAREIGQASLERMATYNLAEARLWHGSLDEALRLARRSEAVQRAHGEGAAHFDQMLIARILAARGDDAELAMMLNVLSRTPLGSADQVVVDVLGCAARRAPAEEWDLALSAAERELGDDLKLELAHLAARRGKLGDPHRAHAAERALAHPIWVGQISAFR